MTSDSSFKNHMRPNPELDHDNVYNGWEEANLHNKYQNLALRGEFDLYKPIVQDIGAPLPPLSIQWKEDYARRQK